MSSSCPIPTAPEVVSREVARNLLRSLGTVPDPRPGGGRRHPVVFVLGVLVAAFTCPGFESFVGAAQWAVGASREVLLGLGAVPDPLTGEVFPPSEATLRRMATTVDPQMVEAAVATWTAAQLPDPTRG